MVPDGADVAALLYLEPHFTKQVVRRDGWWHPWHYISSGNAAVPDNFSLGSGGKDAIFVWTHPIDEYYCIALADFENDIIFSGSQFTYGPKRH